MKNLLPILFLILLLTACSEEKKPKLTYEEQEQQTEKISQDSIQGMMSDLPIQIDSTNYIIHPVGEFRIYERGRSGYFSSDSSFGSYTLTYGNGSDTYTGNLSNLKFQQLESDALTSLTDKNLRISSFSFLRAIFDNTEEMILIIHLILGRNYFSCLEIFSKKFYRHFECFFLKGSERKNVSRKKVSIHHNSRLGSNCAMKNSAAFESI